MRGLVTGEAEEAYLARFLGFDGFREGSAFDDPGRVVIVVDLVELPEVDDIGFESSQAVFEVLAGRGGIASAVLGHEEHLLPTSSGGESLPHDRPQGRPSINPGVIEKT